MYSVLLVGLYPFLHNENTMNSVLLVGLYPFLHSMRTLCTQSCWWACIPSYTHRDHYVLTLTLSLAGGPVSILTLNENTMHSVLLVGLYPFLHSMRTLCTHPRTPSCWWACIPSYTHRDHYVLTLALSIDDGRVSLLTLNKNTIYSVLLVGL